MVTKGGSEKSSSFASMRAAERMAEMLFEKDFNQVIVKYRGLVETVLTVPRGQLLLSEH
jgi:ribosomal protein S11